MVDGRTRMMVALAGISAVSLAALLVLLSMNTGTALNGSADAADSPANEGEALFVAKGCVRCHQHAAVADTTLESLNIGPNLTRYSNDRAFLRLWLSDPRSVRPATAMPNLNLADDEIELLIDFLNQPK